jgi:N-acetylmuramoyl-L-alanine amidase
VSGRSLLAVGAVLLAGCAVGERPTLTNEAIGERSGGGVLDAGAAAGAAVGPDDPIDDELVALPSLQALGEAPPVLVSPSGVLVPVLERTESGYTVQTPCGNEAELVWGHPIREAQVVLDPGHGGDEQGALGPNGATEAELNLDVARRTATLLEGQGLSVVLVRTGDYRVPIGVRAAIADQLQAEAFVSIHHNSPTPANPSDIPGTEVYTQVGSDESARLGGLIYENVVAALSAFDVGWSARTDAGVLTVLNDAGDDAYGINRHPLAPTALVELAYLSSPNEAVLLATTEYRQAAATALASAVVRFLTTSDPGGGFVAEPRLSNPSGATGGGEGCVDPALD